MKLLLNKTKSINIIGNCLITIAIMAMTMAVVFLIIDIYSCITSHGINCFCQTNMRIMWIGCLIAFLLSIAIFTLGYFKHEQKK
jgi:uncharacterized membrane protein